MLPGTYFGHKPDRLRLVLYIWPPTPGLGCVCRWGGWGGLVCVCVCVCVVCVCVFGSVLPRIYHQHLPTSTNVYQQKPMNSRRFLLKASGPKRIRVENTDHTPQFLPEGAATSLGRVLGQGSCLRRCNQNHNKKRPDSVREKAHETSLPVGAPWGPRPLGSPLAQTLLSESPKELNQIASPTNPQRPQSWAPLKAGRPT